MPKGCAEHFQANHAFDVYSQRNTSVQINETAKEPVLLQL